MTDKFVSPCSQPELLEAMAKAHHNKDIEWIGLEAGEEALIAAQWESLPNGAKAAKIECMAAALEVLKNPPEGVSKQLEAYFSREERNRQFKEVE
ncbi:MAG: hypothetical protein P1U50_01215 [Parvibaculaceae bacterium]|nr:hypothetical protein [Parvibaculaceae bacterium]